MRAKEFLIEGRNHPVIVVDVQPAYCNKAHAAKCEQIINFVKKQTGPVLMLVNAERDGTTDDTVAEIRQWWDKMAGGEYTSHIDWQRFQIADKGYGYLRQWMDTDVPAAIIIKVIRLLYQNKVSDTRELFGGYDSDEYETNMKALMGNSWRPWMKEDGIQVNWTSIAQLKRFSGAYLVAVS